MWRLRCAQDALTIGSRKLAAESAAQKKDLDHLRAALQQEEEENAVLLEELNQRERTLADAQARVARLESEKEAALNEAAKFVATLAETRKSAEEDLIMAADALSEAERSARPLPAHYLHDPPRPSPSSPSRPGCPPQLKRLGTGAWKPARTVRSSSGSGRTSRRACGPTTGRWTSSCSRSSGTRTTWSGKSS